MATVAEMPTANKCCNVFQDGDGEAPNYEDLEYYPLGSADDDGSFANFYHRS